MKRTEDPALEAFDRLGDEQARIKFMKKQKASVKRKATSRNKNSRGSLKN
jgi:hypothetical protein